jgi:putative transposase
MSYRWLTRFHARGDLGLNLRQRGRPVQSSTQQRHWASRVLKLRAQKKTWGAGKLRWLLQQKHPDEVVPGKRTLHRWLVRAGKIPRRRRQLRAGSGISWKVAAKRCDDVWTADFKGDIVTKDGRRIVPLTVRDLFSRFVFLLQPMGSLSDLKVRSAFMRLFRRYGLPRAIRVDRGSPFCGTGVYGLTSLSLWWTRLGIEVQFVSRSRSVDNNAHEQMHRILKREACTPVSQTRAAQIRRLQRWRHEYNHRRPHEGTGDQPPATRYTSARRPVPDISAPNYPSTWLTRRVRPHGWVKLCGSYRHIGRAFEGLVVAFDRPTGKTKVYFGNLLLGTVDLSRPRAGIVPVA